MLCIAILMRDYWALLGNRKVHGSFLLRQLAGRLAVLLTVPAAVYLSVFYVHLTVLNHAGPHDTIMTSAFQASLEVSTVSLGRCTRENDDDDRDELMIPSCLPPVSRVVWPPSLMASLCRWLTDLR